MKTILKIFALCIIGIIVGSSIGSAITTVTHNFNIPQSKYVPSVFEVSMTVNGIPWENNTAIKWDDFTVGIYSQVKQFAFTNIGSSNITSIEIVNSDLPSGWTETLSSFGSAILLPGYIGYGNLTLTTPTVPASGNYTWTTAIIIGGTA